MKERVTKRRYFEKAPEETRSSVAVSGGFEPVADKKPAQPIYDYGPGLEYQRLLNTVVRYGCGLCCKTVTLSETPGTIACARLWEHDYKDAEEAERLTQCGVPALYAKVARKEVTELDPEAIRALIPARSQGG